MTASPLEIYATVQALYAALVSFVRISTVILFIFGNFGEILSVLIFVQRTFRDNSCTIYFLAASCSRIVFINFTILLNGLAFGYSIDPTQTSVVFCKIKWYLSSVATILPSTFVVLACIDRLMLSSMSTRMRTWSRPRFACLLVAGVTVFWMVFSIHALIGTSVLRGSGYSYCYIQPGVYTLFQTIYSISINYLLSPTLMLIFGGLTVINVRRAQKQIHPAAGQAYKKRKDLHLLRMLLFQVLVSVIFTVPASIYQIYLMVSVNWVKDPIQQMWDLMYFALALALFYVPNCAGFYIYTVTASVFRKELMRIIVKLYHQLFCRRKTTVGVSTNVN